jgi:cohesin complex subunit SA-1/2
MVMMRKA